MHSTNADRVFLGGDWNTDTSRNSFQSRMFLHFCDANSLYSCADDPCCGFDYTFCSKANGVQSMIDHILLSDNMVTSLHAYDSFDTVENMSDHVAVRCVLDFEVDVCKEGEFSDKGDKKNVGKTKWKFASECDLVRYSEILGDYVKSIQVPIQLMECRDVDCVNHHTEINELHNDIIWACLKAADEVFSGRKPCKAKVIPGWNDFVQDLFRTALFWHNIWTQNDRPTEGILFQLRKKTRKEYHQALKEVIRNSKI